MRIAGTRASYTKGTAGLVYATASSPYLGAYRFDALNTSNAWKAHFEVSGSDIPAPNPSTVGSRRADVAVAPDNAHVLYAAEGMTTVSVYDFDLSTGFSSLVAKTAGTVIPEEFTNVLGIVFSQDESTVVISSKQHLSAYEWDSSGVGAGVIGNVRWSALNYKDPIVSSFPRYEGGPLTAYHYLELEDGPDEVFVQHQYLDTSTSIGGITAKFDTDGTQIGNVPQQQYSQSGSEMFPAPSYSRQVVNAGLQIGTGRPLAFFASDGSAQTRMLVNDSERAGLNAPLDSAGNTHRDVRAFLYDPYGRLILAHNGSDTQKIKIYTQDPDGGAFTFLDGVDPADFSGGVINGFAYDKDQDILFVASQSAPFISAYRMSGSGFDSKYTDMSVSDRPSSAVLSMSLVYDEDWKSYNV